ncbi:MAG: hypothetical protein V1915_01055 [Candidatus Bathyarchaeota archaeon]
MGEKTLTLRIKIANNEVELSGSLEDISKTLEELPKIVERVSISFKTATPTTIFTASPKQVAKTSEDEFPTIGAQIGTSCPEAITSILSTEWGREKPRNLGEIMEAMKVNALHFPIGTIKGRLTDLTKKGTLRRIRGDKGYGYVIAK